jgi:type IV fimbrial biogenesis protein FimT
VTTNCMFLARCRFGMSCSLGTTRRARGFTMTELVAAISITAVLATIAVPAFNELIASQRALTTASDLYIALAKTRSEAITLNSNVTLQANAGGWNAGWQILNINNTVLDNHGVETAVTIAPQATVTYTSSGRIPVGAAAPMFQISTTSGHTVNYQCVSVGLDGRPYMKAAITC